MYDVACIYLGIRQPLRAQSTLQSIHTTTSPSEHLPTLTMIPRRSLRPLLHSLRPTIRHNTRRTLVAAPKEADGPLLYRRSDRALPPLQSSRKFLKTLPLFLIIISASALAIFNYQKSNSSVVTSSLYALRVNPSARAELGEQIYFAHKIPWIWGTIDLLHGKIDIRFAVKGTRGTGEMRFKSLRERRMGFVCAFIY